MADKNTKRPAGVSAKNRRAANKRKNDANKAAHNGMVGYRRGKGLPAATPAVIHPGARPRPRHRPAPSASDFGKWYGKICDRIAA